MLSKMIATVAKVSLVPAFQPANVRAPYTRPGKLGFTQLRQKHSMTPHTPYPEIVPPSITDVRGAR